MSTRPGEGTRVAIVGGGPVGLVLATCLHRAGVEVVVLDRSDDTTPGHGRAGLWEHRTVRTLQRCGLADGMLVHGARHSAFELRCFGERRSVAYSDWLDDEVAHFNYPQDSLVADCRRIFTDAGG